MRLFLLHVLWTTIVNAGCYEPNVAHPLPEYDTEDPVLHGAFGLIETALSTAVGDPDFVDTSFSVEVTSSKETIWSHHHTALTRNTSGPDIPEVNGDALYRIASITKTFTVLGILYLHKAGKISLDDTIDTYIEEFKGEEYGNLPWKDITLRSLASQLSGLPREFAQSDLINRPASLPWEPVDMGLPPLSREGLLKCDEYGDNYEPPCGRGDLLESLKEKAPIFAPNQKSTYSNVAFELLGIVISKVNNQPYESYIEEAIFKPLDMTKSTLSQPPDSAGVIPLEPHYWDVDEGIQNPTGGIYSSSTDLSKYLRYILTHYNGITPALSWVHPVSPADGVYSFYGMPWEIFHTDKVLHDSKRAVRFITKGGGLPGYFSIIMTIPEYDLGITILVAGKQSLLPRIREIVSVNIVRAAEAISIKKLQQRYAGTYSSRKSGLNTSLTLVADHRGLVVTEFVSNSTDILESPILPILGAPQNRAWYSQLVPTLLYRNETEQAGEKWRLLAIEEHDDVNRGVWDDFCSTDVDRPYYAGQPVNELVFWQGDTDRMESVELTAFRTRLVRDQEKDGFSVASRYTQEVLEL